MAFNNVSATRPEDWKKNPSKKYESSPQKRPVKFGEQTLSCSHFVLPWMGMTELDDLFSKTVATEIFFFGTFMPSLKVFNWNTKLIFCLVLLFRLLPGDILGNACWKKISVEVAIWMFNVMKSTELLLLYIAQNKHLSSRKPMQTSCESLS